MRLIQISLQEDEKRKDVIINYLDKTKNVRNKELDILETRVRNNQEKILQYNKILPQEMKSYKGTAQE